MPITCASPYNTAHFHKLRSVLVHRVCHMLGKTHEVMAPTGLLKVMESAVVEPGIRKGLNQNHHSRVLLC